MSDLPISHHQDAQKLEADGLVYLFEITLSTGAKLYLKDGNTVVWQGRTWEKTAIKLTGVGQRSDEQAVRPKLQIINPEGVYSALVDKGALNRAIVSRYTVLRQHLEADLNIYRRQTWILMRVAMLTGNFIVCELRDTTDGPNFLAPARMYLPPEFPAVSIQ